ncbi:hypothetical protein [Microcoleus sp. D2_18a_D3]|uniref:hypothetical protein n=1 Tax=Microcoleus sp. D2_18a_D3 TaxID=3055330 RepID=UPI002FD1A5EC
MRKSYLNRIKEELRAKLDLREEGRRKKEEGRRKKEEGRRVRDLNPTYIFLF